MESGVALTFDDGPHRHGTPQVLEILADQQVRATFFLVGEQVRKQPELAAEIAAAGHEIALHCYEHRNLMGLTPHQTRDDLERADQLISEVTGCIPRLYRPPYGILSASALRFARERKLDTVLWSNDGRDWSSKASPETIYQQITADLTPGAVMLLHDADDYSVQHSWTRTVAALPQTIERVRELDLEFTDAF